MKIKNNDYQWYSKGVDKWPKQPTISLKIGSS